MTIPQDQFSTLTPAQRAYVFERLQTRWSRVESRPPLVPRARGGPLSLSFAQQRLWFFAQLEPESPLYTIAHAWRLVGELDVAVLERSLNELVRRHEVLRTSFPQVEGHPVQRIAQRLPLSIPVIDLTTVTGQREEKLDRMLSEDVARPFAVAEGPLLRVCLYRVDPQEHILLLTGHHIVSDGWSQPILVRELSLLYNAFLVGQPSPLPELAVQYADYALWQRAWLQGETLEQELRFWRERLTGASPILKLPTDHPRPAIQRYRGMQQPFTIAPPLSTQLKLLSQREGVTMFMILLASFQTLLWQYTGQTDLIIGAPVANRPHPAVEPLIGFFVNTLVLRTNLAGNPPITDLLQQVRGVALDAFAHQELPFEKLVEEVSPVRALSYHPLFQIMFAFRQAGAESLHLTGVSASSLDLVRNTAKFDLTLNLEEGQAGVKGFVEYSTDLFEAETIRRLIDHYQTLLVAFVADPHQRLADLRLFTPIRQQGLEERAAPADSTDASSLAKASREAPSRSAGPDWELEQGGCDSRASLEGLLAGIWADVLQMDQVGREENFFELGGHSLLAAKLIERVRSAFQLDVPLRMLFETQTVAAMAEAMMKIEKANSVPEHPATA